MAVSAPPMPLSQTSIECLDGQTPVAVRTIDLEQCPSELQLPLSSGGHAYRQLLVLVRQDGYPLGWRSFPVSPDGTVSLEGLASGAHRGWPGRQCPNAGARDAAAGERGHRDLRGRQDRGSLRRGDPIGRERSL